MIKVTKKSSNIFASFCFKLSREWSCRIDAEFSFTPTEPLGRQSDQMAEVKRMTQTAIVRELAETTGVNNRVAKHFVESLAELAVRETKKNGVFVLPGIGRLVRAERKARTGRNPATGEAIKIPAKKVVKFRVAKSVKDSIVPPKKTAAR